ncbi:plasmid stabilization system protein ParE [Neorhizobium huautlense]|uniref:Plasmid stabilization system protein ParE n=1 Tax=Neorhizobium huautlense TaxID=67774 RepID=A0ABT9PZU5_9HYPH|nr:type II toxin-antitoxin system RelE/ParE family toxin [Neorhizobium huautlense]MDP9839631.1 plasmid stabilization system protein ParE [Neorhizobium huautlense]
MNASLQWSRDALEDFKKQIAYIAEHNPQAAAKVAERMDDCARKLLLRSTGRPGRVDGTLEKTVPGLPYIMAYAVSADETRTVITILRLIHTARDWRRGKWPPFA